MCVCFGPNQPPADLLHESLPLVMMKLTTRHQVGRFGKPTARGVTRCNKVQKPSLSLLPASALSGEKEEEAGEDGGPAGKKRTAEEASQSAGAALLLHFTFMHF